MNSLPRYRPTKTLRFRLAMGSAMAMVITAAISIALVHQAMRWAMSQSLDALLIEDAEEIRLSLRDLGYESSVLRDEFNRRARGHRRHEWYCKLFDANGELLWSSVNAPPITLAELEEAPIRVRTTADVRQVTLRLEDGEPVRWIRVGASMGPLLQELMVFDRIVLVAITLSLCAAPVLGWFLSGRELEPLHDMVRTASGLMPNDMSARMPIRGEHNELDSLAITINRLLDRIAEYVAEKRDFLADSAHELRTPLAAIRATGDIALSSNRSVNECRELMVQIVEQADSLSMIVNQLLLLSESSMPATSAVRKAFMLNEIVAKSIDIFQAVAETKEVGLILEHNAPAQLLGNRDQWIQVLNNLIDNALKYTPQGGTVFISLTTFTSDDFQPGVTLARLIVRDTGIGIEEEDIAKVFQRFFRADRSRTRLTDVPGSGLGLSICRAVVESHGGSIRCESKLGEGTTFEVLVPTV